MIIHLQSLNSVNTFIIHLFLSWRSLFHFYSHLGISISSNLSSFLVAMTGEEDCEDKDNCKLKSLTIIIGLMLLSIIIIGKIMYYHSMKVPVIKCYFKTS